MLVRSLPRSLLVLFFTASSLLFSVHQALALAPAIQYQGRMAFRSRYYLFSISVRAVCVCAILMLSRINLSIHKQTIQSVYNSFACRHLCVHIGIQVEHCLVWHGIPRKVMIRRILQSLCVCECVFVCDCDEKQKDVQKPMHTVRTMKNK